MKNKETSDVARKEEKVLSYWKEHIIFEKTESKDSPKGEFVFYDGPPFATGLPHYGHILAGTIKDVVPRYKSMRGYRVHRRWGWDCHGLPLENEIERELNLSTKRDIEEIGVKTFNETARKAVLRYVDDWKKIVPRLGRFVDMERDYRTMDTNYTESVWWSFKTLFDKKLVYEGFKSMHLCPRCETTLSNFEVSQGYKDIVDFAVTVKLPIVGEERTYLLVWTTTPWTLPGNMAAAVNKDAQYAYVRVEEDIVILARDRVESVLAGQSYSIEKEVRGAELVGKSYEPPFSFFTKSDLEGKENAWRIYHAPYVSLEEGTGAVHLAPAFGDEDMQLAQEHNVPLVHHVGTDGRFSKEVDDPDLLGQLVKPKGDHQSTDIVIIKKLAHAGKLFAKEKITHSYPLCWRCDTPLLNYATSSWFVRATALKEKLIKENNKIGWVPKEIGEKRFGDWLKNIRDWSVSRARYWGAPIPVWKDSSGETHIFGSIAELLEHTKRSGNTYLVMRHGQAKSNADNFINSTNSMRENGLTEKGKEQVDEQKDFLLKKKITKIVTSPLQRTKETATRVARTLGIPEEEIVFDERLQEIGFGVLDGKPVSSYRDFASTYEERYERAPEKGESLHDVKLRVGECIYELEEKYRDEVVLLVTHEYPAWMLSAVATCAPKEETLALNTYEDDFIKNAEVRELSFVPTPHNDNFELDLHRPYIDEIVLEKGGEKLTRVPDVFDCWYESGSMPFAQQHYPFSHSDTFDPKGGLFKKKRGYPADFIAEGLDQTRGWFYSLLVLGTGLFGVSPYKHVIVNGTILAEDGQKMSKRLKNYPDPMDVVNCYGADAIRYYLISSSVVEGEDLSFSETAVAEVTRKIIVRSENVLSLFESSGGTKVASSTKSPHLIDKWILARLFSVRETMTSNLDEYQLAKASRPLLLFADDLSSWYTRRSRDRFKESSVEREEALGTLRFVLTEYAKLLAPFMPFFAERLYLSVCEKGDEESVHLADWPSGDSVDKNILTEMELVRKIVSTGLEGRSKEGVKVRQPLARIIIKDVTLSDKKEHHVLIEEELNVKSVVFDSSQESDVVFDYTLTDGLKKEGAFRELLRGIQDARKKEGLTQGEDAVLTLTTDARGMRLLEEYRKTLEETASIVSIVEEAPQNPHTLQANAYRFSFSVKKR